MDKDVRSTAPSSVPEPVRQLGAFHLAPPRKFVLPALLLLLSEAPGHGYGLEKQMAEFHLGRIDRPTIYRALARLEADQLIQSLDDDEEGKSRHLYQITPLGEQVLREWMRVIKTEWDALGKVLRRYQETGTVDAFLAEVDGGWSPTLSPGWSSVSTTSPPDRHLRAVHPATPPTPDVDDSSGPGSAGTPFPAKRTGQAAGPSPAKSVPQSTFEIVPDRSVVLIEARSTVGPISFGAVGVTGYVRAAVRQEDVLVDPAPSAHLRVDVGQLRSGNSLYDAELLHRIDARRYPTAEVELTSCRKIGVDRHLSLGGILTFHGVSRPIHGSVQVSCCGSKLEITGEQAFDIREFDVPSPTVLMLRIYPDVKVRLHVEAAPTGETES